MQTKNQELKYRKAVFIVVYKKDKDKIYYLIFNRKKHWKGWEFPKGGIEKGETEMQTVKRELFEETGLKSKKIINHKIKGKYKYPHGFPDRDGIIGQTYSLYSAEVLDGKVTFDSDEHRGFKWLDYKNAQKTLSKQNQKICLGIVNKRVFS